MNLAALDCRIASEGSPNGLGKSLRTINDEKTRHARVETTRAEIVDERLHGCCIFRRTLDDAEWVFVARLVDAERRISDPYLPGVNPDALTPILTTMTLDDRSFGGSLLQK